MIESLNGLLLGFGAVFSGYKILSIFAGAFFGTWIGMLPGIGPATGIAILLPFTYDMDPAMALVLLTGIYFGAMYGGAISSILINTPGDASAVMTTLDGNPLAKKGRAGAALFIAAVASFIGGTLGLWGLTFLSGPISRFALRFGPQEYFALMVFAIVATVTLFDGSVVKGLMSGVFGLMVATVGIDLQSGSARFVFGASDLMDGIGLLVVIIGVFSISEACVNLEKLISGHWEPAATVGKLWATGAEWLRCRWAFIRGSFIGFLVGLLPGAGGAVATLFAYSTEKRMSRHPEEFGKGAIEGVAAPEAANNASVSGALIPLLTLGIPGSSATAVLLGALMMYGIQPGPQMFMEYPDITWGVIASLYIANVLLVVLNIPLIGLWVRLLKIPGELLVVLILVLALTGSYALGNSLFDTGLVIFFGAIGYWMKKQDFPFAPMILGVVLGKTLEQSLRQSLVLSGNDWSTFIARPLSGTILVLSILSFLGPPVIKKFRQRS